MWSPSLCIHCCHAPSESYLSYWGVTVERLMLLTGPSDVWKKLQTTDRTDFNLKCVGPLRRILKPYCLRLDNNEHRRQEKSWTSEASWEIALRGTGKRFRRVISNNGCHSLSMCTHIFDSWFINKFEACRFFFLNLK